MIRLLACGLVLCGTAAAVRAGELDMETTPVKVAVVVNQTTVPASTELDIESPAAAFHYRGYGYGGYHRGYYGGWGGYRGYGGWGGYRPFFGFGLGYGGFYGAYANPYFRIGFGYPGFGFGYGRPYGYGRYYW